MMSKNKFSRADNKAKIARALTSVAVGVGATVLAAAALDSRVTVRRYAVNNADVVGRIVHLSDLHSQNLTDGEIAKIESLAPDLIVMTGDMVDDKKDVVRGLTNMARIANIAPCYYVSGNHEERRRDTVELYSSLEALGIHVLHEVAERVPLAGGHIVLCGTADHASYANRELWERAVTDVANRARGLAVNGERVVLLTHRPEFCERGGLFSKLDVDMILSGHTHGGQTRIPFLLDGLYATGQGMFPKYAGGQHEIPTDCGRAIDLIISRGLDSRVTRPRIFNRPEIVAVEFRLAQNNNNIKKK